MGLGGTDPNGVPAGPPGPTLPLRRRVRRRGCRWTLLALTALPTLALALTSSTRRDAALRRARLEGRRHRHGSDRRQRRGLVRERRGEGRRGGRGRGRRRRLRVRGVDAEGRVGVAGGRRGQHARWLHRPDEVELEQRVEQRAAALLALQPPRRHGSRFTPSGAEQQQQQRRRHRHPATDRSALACHGCHACPAQQQQQQGPLYLWISQCRSAMVDLQSSRGTKLKPAGRCSGKRKRDPLATVAAVDDDRVCIYLSVCSPSPLSPLPRN